MKYYFNWNGTSCGTKGIMLQSMPEIIRPEERVNHIIIPGRPGELTQLEGEYIYNSYIQTIPLIIYTESAVREAEQWLQGDGYVTFSCQPDLKQRARVINAVTFRKHSRNSNWWEGEIQFYCEPLKEAVTTEEDIEVTTSGATVTNPGDVDAKPRIEITGSGDITLQMGGSALILTGVTSGMVVDSDTEWVLKNGVPQQGVYTGKFPVLKPGDNTVAFTGSVTKLTITPRWRYL